MISEIPTFLLSLGSFDSYFRNDSLFGITFFITRIIYHIILTWIFRKHSSVLFISLSALGLHLYWFYTWFKKYGSSLIFKKKEPSSKIKIIKKVNKKISETRDSAKHT